MGTLTRTVGTRGAVALTMGGLLLLTPAAHAGAAGSASDGASAAALAPATGSVVVVGKPKPLTVSGTMRDPVSGLRVLLVAANGATVSAPVAADGSFRLRVSGAKRLAAFAPGRRGTGASLQLTRGGVYAGPFLLARLKGKASGRLAPDARGQVPLGAVAVDPAGYVRLDRTLPKSRVDRRHLMRLVGGVPAGAGTFGATGRLAATALRQGQSHRSAPSTTPSVAPADALPPNASGAGADADADGVPNLADVDMNGDQVLDAAQLAQPQATADGERLAGQQVLAGRPWPPVNVIKILDTSDVLPVNSNVNTDVTWEELTAYLRDNLGIEAAVESNNLRELFCPGTSAETPCEAARQVASVEMNCAALVYCGAQSEAMLMTPYGDPGDTLLRDILLPNGAVPLLRDPDDPGGYYSVYFMPRVTDQANLLFVGDTYEFVWRDAAGGELARRASVVTSSVATAPEFTAVAGQPYTLPRDERNPVRVTPAESRAVTIGFHRPQRLSVEAMTDAAPVLLDRGGLDYEFTIWSLGEDGGEGYWCRPEQIIPAGPDLVALEPQPGPQGSRVGRLRDTNLAPSNGGILSYTVDIASCLADPAFGPGSPPQAGTVLSVGLESFDSDNNRTRSGAYLTIG